MNEVFYENERLLDNVYGGRVTRPHGRADTGSVNAQGNSDAAAIRTCIGTYLKMCDLFY